MPQHLDKPGVLRYYAVRIDTYIEEHYHMNYVRWLMGALLALTLAACDTSSNTPATAQPGQVMTSQPAPGGAAPYPAPANGAAYPGPGTAAPAP